MKSAVCFAVGVSECQIPESPPFAKKRRFLFLAEDGKRWDARAVEDTAADNQTMQNIKLIGTRHCKAF